MLLDVIGHIADVLGIAGFALTVVLLIKSEAIRKELEAQNKTYKRERQHIEGNFIGLLSAIREENLFNDETIDKIRIEINKLELRFSRLLSRQDRKHIKETHAILDNIKEPDSRDALCKELAYFIARMEKVGIT